MRDFDESKVKRADDGKFSETQGSGAPKDPVAAAKVLKKATKTLTKASAKAASARAKKAAAEALAKAKARAKEVVAKAKAKAGKVRVAKTGPRGAAKKVAAAKKREIIAKAKKKAAEIVAKAKKKAADKIGKVKAGAGKQMKEPTVKQEPKPTADLSGATDATNSAGSSKVAESHKPRQVSPSEFVEIEKAHAEKMTQEEIDTALNYSGTGYLRINQLLREGRELGARSAMVDTLDRLIDKSRIPYDMTVLRGARGEDVLAHYAGMKAGDVFVEKAYTSTTADHAVKHAFDGEVELRITLPEGSRGAAIPSRYQGEDDENEVLLPRGQKFRIEKSDMTETPSKFAGRPAQKKLILQVVAIQE